LDVRFPSRLVPLSWRGHWPTVLIACLAVVLAIAGMVTLATHVMGPALFTHYEQFPALENVPKRSRNARNVEGDPINVAIVAGSDSELVVAFQRAGWVEAQPVTRATSIAIAKSVLLGRPDSTAPVSPLYLFGRQQDHAFEREAGKSASRRHHVRLWRADGVTYEGRPVWIGGASFDTRAGLSRRGLHPTHHIDPDIDQERDRVEADLARVGQVAKTFHVTGYGLRVDAHNAEGDRFDTDGELLVIVVSPGNVSEPAPTLLPDPPLVRLKQAAWNWFHRGKPTAE
jgi:LssY C-terminus